MLRFEWNALRPGDHVLVHDQRTTEMTLAEGVVTSVDAHKGVNGVGIRVGAKSDETAVLWPSHLVVHHDWCDPSTACWRCQTLAEQATRATPMSGSPAAIGAGAGPRAELALRPSGAR